MKVMTSFIFTLFIVCFANGKEKTFTASTPAGNLIKQFLGIPISDSIDYLQWRVVLREKSYSITCNYTILAMQGQTKETKRLELNGSLYRNTNIYRLNKNTRVLRLAEINSDLLHILNSDNSLLIGNGGWSYTMNSVHPSLNNDIFLRAKPTVIKDSMIFVGRTPCGDPRIIPQNNPCYKLKWKIVFYGNPSGNLPTKCIVYATPYRKEAGKRGTWKIVAEPNGKILYQLYDENGKPFLYLQKADENILLFTDADGRLLTGDEDFSFTLNRSM